jgi:tight adherence protein C
MAMFTITETSADRFHKRIMRMKLFAEEKNHRKLKRNESLLKRIYSMIESRVIKTIDKQVRKGNFAKIEMKLLQGGVDDVTPMQFFAQKVIFCILGSIVGLALKKPMAIILFAALGFLYADYKLKKKIEERQFLIKSELPDFLDLVASTFPACANIEDTLERVCARTKNTVSHEFEIALREINNGRKKREALNELSYRMGIQEVKMLIASINQAETFGTGLEETLQVQAKNIRRLKKTMAEMRAGRANFLLLIPSTFLLITAVILIIGPSIIQFIEAMNMFS